jgi:hypothetical protein
LSLLTLARYSGRVQGEGSTRLTPDLLKAGLAPNPHPNPLPEYRTREKRDERERMRIWEHIE